MKIKLRALEVAVFQSDKSKLFWQSFAKNNAETTKKLRNANICDKISAKVLSDLADFFSFIREGKKLPKANCINATAIAAEFEIPIIKFKQIHAGGLKRFHKDLKNRGMTIEEFINKVDVLVIEEMTEIIKKIS